VRTFPEHRQRVLDTMIRLNREYRPSLGLVPRPTPPGRRLVSRAGRWEVASLDQPSRLLPLAGTPVPSSPSVPGPSRSAS